MSAEKFEDLVSSFQFMSAARSAQGLVTERQAFEKFAHRIEKEGQTNNSLFVSQLYDMFKTFSDKMFAFSPEEFFHDLLNALDNVFPFDAKLIRNYINAFGFHLADDGARENILLQGEIQSGKTALIVLSSLCYLACGRDVFVITRNKTQDKNQFVRRFSEIVRYLKNNEGLTNKNFTAIDGKNGVPDHPCIFVELFLAGNLNKLYEKVRGRNLKDAVVFIDEADLRDSYVAKVIKKAGKVVYVSATVQDILVSEWEIKAANVVSLVPSGIYKGVRSLRIEARKLEDAREFFYTLCDVAVDNEFQKFHRGHPKIVLINIDRTLKAIGDIFEQLKQDKFDVEGVMHHIPKEMKDVCLIKYTGEGVKLHHKSFEGEKEIAKKNRLHSVTETFRWLSKNGGNKRFPNIVIIAGCMADRGINFADYESGWHLTHQIMIKPKTASCASALQGCRILGNFRDLIPLKLFTTEEIKSKIEKSYAASKKIIRQLRESEMKDEFTNNVCAREVELDEKEALELDRVKFLREKSGRTFKVKEGGETEQDYKRRQKKKVEIRGQTESQDGKFHRIVPEMLSAREEVIYKNIFSFFGEMKNVWVRRSEVVQYMISLGEREHPMQAHMKDMCLKKEKHYKTANEFENGLLFKKENNRWFLRIN